MELISKQLKTGYSLPLPRIMCSLSISSCAQSEPENTTFKQIGTGETVIAIKSDNLTSRTHVEGDY